VRAFSSLRELRVDGGKTLCQHWAARTQDRATAMRIRRMSL